MTLGDLSDGNSAEVGTVTAGVYRKPIYTPRPVTLRHPFFGTAGSVTTWQGVKMTLLPKDGAPPTGGRRETRTLFPTPDLGPIGGLPVGVTRERQKLEAGVAGNSLRLHTPDRGPGGSPFARACGSPKRAGLASCRQRLSTHPKARKGRACGPWRVSVGGSSTCPIGL